jgi:hypothetical protein
VLYDLQAWTAAWAVGALGFPMYGGRTNMEAYFQSRDSAITAGRVKTNMEVVDHKTTSNMHAWTV